jgi:hypothetical protein
MSLHPIRQAAQFLLGVPTQGINPALGRMLDLAQATPLCFVAVAGPEAGEAMSQLWRRGYQRVEAARKATCRAADEQSDVLLILGCETLADARAVAASTMTMLRPGGTLIIDAGAFLDQAPRRQLCESLRELGLETQPQAHLSAEILATRPFAKQGGLTSKIVIPAKREARRAGSAASAGVSGGPGSALRFARDDSS